MTMTTIIYELATAYTEHIRMFQDAQAKSALIFLYRTDLDHPIGTVERRNQRERFRVRSINSTFRVLEAMLPSPGKFGKIKKPSKADVLRNAILYIESLQCLITGGEPTNRDLEALHEAITQRKHAMALPALEQVCSSKSDQDWRVETSRRAKRSLSLQIPESMTSSRYLTRSTENQMDIQEEVLAIYDYQSWWKNSQSSYEKPTRCGFQNQSEIEAVGDGDAYGNSWASSYSTTSDIMTDFF